MASNKSNLFAETQKKSKQATPGEDQGLINENGNTTITTRKDGSTTLNSGIYAQYKVDKNSGVATEFSEVSTTNTVQKDLTCSDLIINRHKFNTQLIEFSDLKLNMNTIMGHLMMNSTILVKTWEPNLNQYVLMRRPASFPIFGNMLDAYVLDNRFTVDSEYSFDEDLIEYKRNLNNLKVENNETTEEEGKA